MTPPSWLNEDVTMHLQTIRSAGEGQFVEFMESFPEQVRDLAKEVAAFASTNEGLILIGLNDSGITVGIENASTPDQRDQILNRIQGICHGTVKPAVTPEVRWIEDDDKSILAIKIPKGSEPMYYCNSIPYVRHVTESRPAEPHEVARRHLAWTIPVTTILCLRVNEEQMQKITRYIRRAFPELAFGGEQIDGDHRHIFIKDCHPFFAEHILQKLKRMNLGGRFVSRASPCTVGLIGAKRIVGMNPPIF